MKSLDMRGWAKTAMRATPGALFLALGVWFAAHNEMAALSPVESAGPTSRTLLLSRAPAWMEDRVVREIRDPDSGACWLLMRDGAHPGGPGRLVLAEKPPIVEPENQEAKNQPRSRQGAESSYASRVPVIHAGERLMVEEHTPVVEAHLEAVALGPAAIGGELNVRLRMGGKVLRAVALGPGRAELQAEREARP
jgi:hypothetical protein